MTAGDWDLDSMKLKSAGATFETDLSADEKTLAEVKAACMIIDERMSAYDADLSSFQTKLEGLNERMMQAERSYAVRALTTQFDSATGRRRAACLFAAPRSAR